MPNVLNSKKSYSLLDIVKLVMALLVVTIHRRIGSEDNCLVYLEVNTIARLAVPFFFACSSFLFFRKNTEYNGAMLKSFVLKNLRIYLIWYLIILPGTIFKYIYSFKYSIGEILYNLVFDHFRYPIHLWFLPALALSVAIIYLLTKRNEKAAAVTAVIMIFLSAAYKLSGLNFSNSYVSFITGTLFLGIPYVYMGYYISRHEINLKKPAIVTLLLMSVAASLAWGMADFYGIFKTVFIDNKLTYLPVVFFLMLFCINFSSDKNYIRIRKASMLIYYIHLVIYQEILYIALDILGFNSLIESKPAIFLITIGYTLLLTVLIITLENKKGFRWLKKLYN